jgi:hypothetical protein
MLAEFEGVEVDSVHAILADIRLATDIRSHRPTNLLAPSPGAGFHARPLPSSPGGAPAFTRPVERHTAAAALSSWQSQSLTPAPLRGGHGSSGFGIGSGSPAAVDAAGAVSRSGPAGSLPASSVLEGHGYDAPLSRLAALAGAPGAADVAPATGSVRSAIPAGLPAAVRALSLAAESVARFRATGRVVPDDDLPVAGGGLAASGERASGSGRAATPQRTTPSFSASLAPSASGRIAFGPTGHATH